MTKQETIKYLTELMTTVQMAYFKGRIDPKTLPISESLWTPGEIGIDLYNYGTKPVCDGLKGCCVSYDDDTEDNGDVFAMHYNADDVTPLTFLVDFYGRPEIQVEPESLPEEVLANIAQWLKKAMKPAEPEKFKNNVTSFFFYMWNKWCEEECRLVFGNGDFWPHFWKKWCHFCDKTNSRDAVAGFYAELSDTNRDKLVARALELYDGMTEK